MKVFALLIALWILWRAVYPLQIRRIWKIALAIPVLAASFKFQLTHLFGGPMFFAPQLPSWVLLGAAWCYAVVFLLFFLLLIAETMQLLFRLCRRRTSIVIHNRINLGLLLGAILLATWGIGRGTALPQLRMVTLSFPNLPKEADSMTIALLADLHADAVNRADKIRAVVDRTNQIPDPDLVVIAGDFVDGTVAQRGKELEPIRELTAKYGVWAVPGNHEYYSGYAPWMEFFQKAGIKMLLNSHTQLPNGIILAGVTDPAAARMGEIPPDIAGALAQAPRDSFQILLAHQPIPADAAQRAGISLQLSGHTHGGMIWGIDRLVGLFNGNYSSGLYSVGTMKLYVSNGSGIWSGFPIRLGHDSEITVIRLLRAN
ncbi:MAG: metallophosphoesterase [Victivallaceae bacterium]|nr:metallophosphoesterase [Victivallaceae bacterium]